MSQYVDKIQRPSFFLFITEIFRAVKDFMKVGDFIRNYKVKRRGDRHTILVIPGFLGSDRSTKPLRTFLNKNGYKTAGWNLGTNLADLNQIETISAQINRLYQESNKKITLIGWSLGGVYARQLAKAQPNKIKQVITMGSPFGGVLEPNNATVTYNFVKWLKGYPEIDPDFLIDLPKPAPVMTTAIYSKKDGIVPWKVCMEKIEDNLHQNIEVHCSHLGMGANAHVLEIVADKLLDDPKQI